MKLQYLSQCFLLCSPVTGKTLSAQLQVTVSSGMSLFRHGCHFLPRVSLQPLPQQHLLCFSYTSWLPLLNMFVLLWLPVALACNGVVGLVGLVSELWKILTFSHTTPLQPPVTQTLPFMPNTISPCKSTRNRVINIFLDKFTIKIILILRIIWAASENSFSSYATYRTAVKYHFDLAYILAVSAW